MTCVLATTASVCQISSACQIKVRVHVCVCVMCVAEPHHFFALAFAFALAPSLAISMLLLARAHYLSVEYLINFFEILWALISKSFFDFLVTYSSRL